MTETWYKTNSTDGGYNLNNPTVSKIPPNTNFEPYNIPTIGPRFYRIIMIFLLIQLQ